MCAANFNVTGLVDNSGSVQERYVYDPYGAVTVLAGNWGSRSTSLYGWVYNHQGLRFVLDVGLYYVRYRDLSPTLMRPVQQDPVWAPNLYVGYGNSPGNHVDPLGLWQIDRDRNQFRAKATAEPKDTFLGLAATIGLRADQLEKWLTLPKGTVNLETKAGARLEELKPEDKVCKGEVLEIPNQIIFLWLGALEGLGKAAIGWERDKDWLAQRQFHVSEFPYVPGKSDPKFFRDALFASLRRSTSADGLLGKTLHGLVVAGHGGHTGLQSHDRKVIIGYREITDVLQYRLALVILNVCCGNHSVNDKDFKGTPNERGGRDLSSQSDGDVFYGTKEIHWPIKDTMHPSRLMKPGDQGTKK